MNGDVASPVDAATEGWPRQEGRQPREHAVPCRVCRSSTWAVSAVCERCAEIDASSP